MTNKAQIDYNDKSVDGVLETQTQGWQYGRRRRIHWAMAEPHLFNVEKSALFNRWLTFSDDRMHINTPTPKQDKPPEEPVEGTEKVRISLIRPI